MITIDVMVSQLPGLRREDLERWISNDWVKPDRNAGRYVFRQIDVARVRLIQELRDDLKIDEDALSVVLLLLDQLYDQRRRMRELAEAVARIAPDDVRQDLIRHLTKPG